MYVYVYLCVYVTGNTLQEKELQICTKKKITKLSPLKDKHCHNWLIFFQTYFYTYTCIYKAFPLEVRLF